MVERLFFEIHKIKNISHSIEGSKFIKIYKKLLFIKRYIEFYWFSI